MCETRNSFSLANNIKNTSDKMILKKISTFQRIYIPFRHLMTSSTENCQNKTFPIDSSPENLKRTKIEKEIEELMSDKSTSIFLPSKIPQKEWPYLISLPSRNQRRRFYRYLKNNEDYADREKRKKATRQDAYLKRIERNESNDHIKYYLGANALFTKIRRKSMSKFYNHNLANAVLFGQKIVFDVDFEDEMDRREHRTCVSELQACYQMNKLAREPFHLHFCNVNYGNEFFKNLVHAIPHLKTVNPLVTVTSDSYLKLFPKERLVYLTPNSKVDLVYDADDVYIIGGLVDARPKPVTMEKALREGIRTAKLPIAKYAEVDKNFYPNLIIKQVLKVLIKMSTCRDWKTAFRELPEWRKEKNNS
uniref:RNA (guanine-9-)-methyltransferase domain-containing protein 1 n=1 Tax=Strigamia maritima TaxID=126957 RepID=T1JFY7_STRMM